MIPASGIEDNDRRVICFPLGEGDSDTGAISFVFLTDPVPDSKRLLARVAKAMQSIWQLWHAREAYARSVIRIAELEAELADSRIADRAIALLERPRPGMSLIDAVAESVDTVIRPYQLRPVLDQVARDLEHDLAEYRLVSKAKSVLQSRSGMSEEQAYLHLRLVSRQTRRRLRDIAVDLIQDGIMPRHREARPRLQA